jgi:hypothetical protein
MRIAICFLCSLLSVLHTRTTCAQKFIDLRAVPVTGTGWPPDPAAHGIIVDSVITTFDPHAAIGMVQKGLGNRPANAFFKGDARTELKALLDRLRTGANEGEHVVLKVDTIEISERTLATREMAFCRFAAEVLTRSDSGWTSTYSFGTTLVHSGGMDATDDHASNIAHALDNCLRRYVRARDRSFLRSRLISDRQLRRPFTRRADEIAALSGNRAKKGVYFSFMDFVEGTPDTTTSVDEKVSKHTTETTRVLKLRSGGTELMAWGYSDGVRLYVNTGGEYNEVQFGREGMYTYWSPGAGGEVNTGLVITAGIFFGALGAGAAALATSGRPDAPMRLDLDLIAGTLTRTHGTKSTTRDSEHWFYYTDHSASDTTVCLFLYGGEEGCLRRGQHRVIRLTPRVAPAPVELNIGDQRIHAELNTNATTDQVYLVSVNRDGIFKVDKLSVSMASSVLDKLKPEDEVK